MIDLTKSKETVPESDPVEEISREITASRPKKTGMLAVSKINDAIERASLEPDPVDLYHKLIWQGQIHFLFGDTGLGKTIFAYQVAEAIAISQPVIYLDCEMTEKMIEKRYKSEDGHHHVFPDDLYRVEIRPDTATSENFESEILESLEAIAKETKAKVVFVDNLTYILNDSEKGVKASTFMKEIKNLRDKNGWTVVIIAHTAKRNLYVPITENDMAGSKRLLNFVDMAISLSASSKDFNLRYVKQIKCRTAEKTYHENNVLILGIEHGEDGLRMYESGTAKEREHLKIRAPDDDATMEQEVLQLTQNGFSLREIAGQLGISKSTVGRILKAEKEKEFSQNTLPFLKPNDKPNNK